MRPYREIIEEYRPYWLAVANKITGSRADAEDAVQNALIKWWLTDQSQIEHVKSYITRAVVTQSINLKAWLGLRRTLELTNALRQNTTEYAAQLSDYEAEVLAWLGQMSQKLSPIEQGVLLMKEVLQLSYEDIATHYNRNSEYCRQIIMRARRNMNSETIRFKTPAWEVSELHTCLMEAIERDVATPLLELLRRPVNG